MFIPRRRRVDQALTLAVLVLSAVVGRSTPSAGQPVDDPPARQVTLLGVIASSSDRAIDPKLAKFEPQLRKLLPDHGFRLLDVQSERLSAGETVTCNFESGFTSSITLLKPADDNGKVQLRCSVVRRHDVLIETVVTTPPNQLFFCDKVLEGGNRLLIGVGAR